MFSLEVKTSLKILEIFIVLDAFMKLFYEAFLLNEFTAFLQLVSCSDKFSLKSVMNGKQVLFEVELWLDCLIFLIGV